MTFVPRYKISLVLSFVVNLHGDECTRGESTARNLTTEGRLAAVGIQVFAQVDKILTAVFTVFTAVGSLVAVAELDMVAQCRG